MKTLNKKEKEIIKLIQNQKITDIFSFIRYYNLGTEICYNEQNVTDKFNNIFAGKEYIIKHNRDKSLFLDKRCIIEEIDDDTTKCKPFLTFEKIKTQTITMPDITRTYNLYKPIYICEDMNKILQFIAIWQYLEEEKLIIELPKSCKQEDAALFFSKSYKNLPEVTIDESCLNFETMKIYADSFMDWELKLNKTNFELCYPYLCKKIFPTLSLDTFIGNNYKTKSDINDSRNFKIALIGVIVAIVTSFASLIISLSEKDYKNELNNINKSLQEINNKLTIGETVTNEVTENPDIP